MTEKNNENKTAKNTRLPAALKTCQDFESDLSRKKLPELSISDSKTSDQTSACGDINYRVHNKFLIVLFIILS